MVGRRRGTYTVFSRKGSNQYGSRQWLCRCDCGRESFYTTGQILSQGEQRMSCAACQHESQEEENRIYEIPPRFWTRATQQAARRNIEFKLSQKEAQDLFKEQKGKCALTGTPLHFTRLRTNYNRYTTASLDRIDSSRSYGAGNVQWVHKEINMMKQQLSQETFIQWCRKVAAQNA